MTTPIDQRKRLTLVRQFGHYLKGPTCLGSDFTPLWYRIREDALEIRAFPEGSPLPGARTRL